MRVLAGWLVMGLMVVAGGRGQEAKVEQVHVDPRVARITEVVAVPGLAAGVAGMDFYKASGAGLHPAVVIVHGGGFTGGTSRNGSEAYAADFLTPAGYAVFSVNYRLATEAAGGASFAQMVEDVQQQIRFVRANAGRFGVDAGKIALLGGSAGGYLSNMVGVLRPERGDEVQAVVTLYGISDVETMPDPTFVSKYHLAAAGKDASPMSHVRAGAPPFLFIHGDHDESVPIAQSVRLMDALHAAGDKAELIAIPGGPHGTWPWAKLPGVPDWERQMVEWLNRTLGFHGGPIGAGIEARPVH